MATLFQRLTARHKRDTAVPPSSEDLMDIYKDPNTVAMPFKYSAEDLKDMTDVLEWLDSVYQYLETGK